MIRAYYKQSKQPGDFLFLIEFDDLGRVQSVSPPTHFTQCHSSSEERVPLAPQFESAMTNPNAGLFVGPINPRTGNTYAYEA